MSRTHQHWSLGFAALFLLLGALACSGPGGNDNRDHAIKDDPTKSLRNGIAGKVVAECLGHESTVTGVAVSPDGELAVSTSFDLTLRFWSVPDGKLIRTIHAVKPQSDSATVGSPQFSADGKSVAALVRAGKSGKLCFWDTKTGKELPRSIAIEEEWGLVLSPDGERVSSGRDSVRVRDTREHKIVWEFPLRKEERVEASAFSFSPDGNHLAVGLTDLGDAPGELSTGRQSLGSKVRVWGLRTGQLAFASETLPLTKEARWVKGPDGTWDFAPEKQPYKAHAVAFSPDGTRLAAGGVDFDRTNSVWVWDLATRKVVQKLPVGEPCVSDLAFSPDGHMLARATGWSHNPPDPEIQIWNVSSGKLLGSLRKHTGDGVNAVAWGKDGRTLVSCGIDRRVLIWRLEPR